MADARFDNSAIAQDGPVKASSDSSASSNEVRGATPTAVCRLLVPGTPEALPQIREMVTEAAEQGDFSPEAVLQIEMAVDEACTNVIEHAYKASPIKHEVEVVVSQFHDRMEIVINDYSSVDFPVHQVPNIAPDEYFDTERQRGLGLYIINNFVDRVEHRFIGGQGNELRLTKFHA